MHTRVAQSPVPAATGLAPDWMSTILDQLDYGLMVVDGSCAMRYANRVAHHAMRSGTSPLLLDAGRVQACDGKDAAALRHAVEQACHRELRALLNLGGDQDGLALAVVPIRETVGADGGGLALLVTGRIRVCETLTAQMYALVHGLTYAETRVLEMLCTEASPETIARRLKVALSTVRTQMGSIRAKTGTPSIGALVREIALLPPLVMAWH